MSSRRLRRAWRRRSCGRARLAARERELQVMAGVGLVDDGVDLVAVVVLAQHLLRCCFGRVASTGVTKKSPSRLGDRTGARGSYDGGRSCCAGTAASRRPRQSSPGGNGTTSFSTRNCSRPRDLAPVRGRRSSADGWCALSLRVTSGHPFAFGSMRLATASISRLRRGEDALPDPWTSIRVFLEEVALVAGGNRRARALRRSRPRRAARGRARETARSPA